MTRTGNIVLSYNQLILMHIFENLLLQFFFKYFTFIAFENIKFYEIFIIYGPMGLKLSKKNKS